MDMETQGLPDWVQPIATIFVALAVLTALAVAFDINGRGYRQRSAAVEGVWIISALWLGPFALPLAHTDRSLPHGQVARSARPFRGRGWPRRAPRAACRARPRPRSATSWPCRSSSPPG